MSASSRAMPSTCRWSILLAHRVDDFHDPWRATEPVVLLHGFARTGEFWRGWVPVLPADRPVIRPDLRGCGASAWLQPTYRTDVLVRDVLDLMDAEFLAEPDGSRRDQPISSGC